MKRIIILLVIMLLALPVFAGTSQRLIVKKSSFLGALEKLEIDIRGCSVRHDLRDAFAVECPEGTDGGHQVLPGPEVRGF